MRMNKLHDFRGSAISKQKKEIVQLITKGLNKNIDKDILYSYRLSKNITNKPANVVLF